MNVLDQYIEELKVDTAIDEFTMKDVQMKLPGVKHKWVGRLMRAKLEIGQLNRKRYKLVNDMGKQLVKESPIAISLPVAKKKVESHEDIINVDSEIQELKLITELLDKSERILNSMTFDIRNMTEIIKLETQ